MALETRLDDREQALADLRRLVEEGNKNPVQPMSDADGLEWQRQLDESAALPKVAEKRRTPEITDDERYIEELKSDPERCKEVYKDAVSAFVGAEIAAGATLQEVARKHAGRSLSNGPETHKLELARRALHQIYGQEEEVRTSEQTFDAEIAKLAGVGGEKIAEQIRGNVIKSNLSYSDADISDEAKADALAYVQASDNAKKYADALVAMTEQYDLAAFERTTRGMIDECKGVLDRLGIEPTPYARSATWGMWDIGKQYHFLLHPEENDSKYRIANPMEDFAKRAEIVDRHVGWEAFAAHQHGDTDFVERLPQANREKAIEYLGRAPQPENGTLSSKELAELGALLRI